MRMNKKKLGGFTLIEVLVVVAIIGILAAVALPSYNRYVLESRRTDGMAKLTEVMQAQERNFANNLTYTVALGGLGYVAPVASADGNYTIVAGACGAGIAECVVLTAIAQGAQLVDGNLTLNSLGVKARVGATGVTSGSTW